MTIALPNSGVYRCVSSPTLAILEGEYARVTARTFDGITYIDSQTFYYIDLQEMFKPASNVENVLLRYGGLYLGMNSSHNTISTEDFDTALSNDAYHFNLIYSRVSGNYNMLYIQNVATSNYYLSTSPGWSSTRAEIYCSAENYLQTGNNTDGSNRIVLSGTTLSKSSKQQPGGVWSILKPVKTGK